MTIQFVLAQVDPNTLWGRAIHKALEDKTDLNSLVASLQSQAKDEPDTMKSILGPVYDIVMGYPVKATSNNSDSQNI